MIPAVTKPRLDYAAMMRLPSKTAAYEFRVFLDACGYNTDGLTNRIGAARPPSEGEAPQMFEDSREISTFNVLVRLFLLGAPVDEQTVGDFLPDAIAAFCRDHGLVETRDGMTQGTIVIIPVEDLLFASDAFRLLGTEESNEFVLPASTHSANFLRYLTLRNDVDDTLDLGCGCGIHALFAARHSKRVTATDISTRALDYTRFNALLNGIDNVECLEGSLFDPVANRRFDLIVTNPPFVIGPSEAFVYRDNPMQLDEFCATLVREAPSCLADGGILQVLCEWVEIEGQAWTERIGGWIRGCDAWILHAHPLTPSAYVQHRSTDISGEAVNTGSVSDWQAYFEDHRVRAVHPGLLVLRRRSGSNWLHVQNLPGDVTVASGEAIASGIAAVDFLEACNDEALLEATLALTTELQAEHIESDDQPGMVLLRMTNGLGTETEIDGSVAAFLNLFSGKRTVGECIREFGALTEAELEHLTNDLLSIVRAFVSRGFLEPVEL